MIQWFKQTFCNHDWKPRVFSSRCYDQEIWYECTKCNKQSVINKVKEENK